MMERNASAAFDYSFRGENPYSSAPTIAAPTPKFTATSRLWIRMGISTRVPSGYSHTCHAANANPPNASIAPMIFIAQLLNRISLV